MTRAMLALFIEASVELLYGDELLPDNVPHVHLIIHYPHALVADELCMN